MRDYRNFYIDGRWVPATSGETRDVINPANGQVAGVIAMANGHDVDLAAQAARRAFGSFAATTREERLGLLRAIADEYRRRYADVASAVTEEMGAPGWLAEQYQAGLGIGHIESAIKVLEDFAFEEPRGTTMIVKEPIGVCGLITPWNWPINQIAAKVMPALAVGCTIVLKPSEVAPFSAIIWTEILDAAGVPAGVFNLVNGDGPTAGSAISEHPEIDMISFTGSTRAGVEVARAAAPSVKRVHQELGGKSANIILEDAKIEEAVAGGVQAMMLNTGQSCNAPSRMLVPGDLAETVKTVAKATVDGITVGDPTGNAFMGPVVSEAQWSKIQGYIESGISEGATLVTGGLGRPSGLDHGFYVKPTVFADVTPSMTIAREEIFGPVLAIMNYETEEQAIEIANDSPYGLAGYVQSGDIAHARAVASKIRAGQININGAAADLMAPFGGFKMSGNGREWGDFAFHDFVEVKAVIGFEAPAAH